MGKRREREGRGKGKRRLGEGGERRVDPPIGESGSASGEGQKISAAVFTLKSSGMVEYRVDQRDRIFCTIKHSKNHTSETE